MSTGQRRTDLDDRLRRAATAGSAKAVERQHARGKLTARERIDLFVDSGSFVEIGALARHRTAAFGLEHDRPYGDGVVTGYGCVNGRDVALFAHDFTVFGGSLGEVFGEKVIAVMDHAARVGCPIVGLNDSGGARIQEGVVSLAYYAEIGRRNARLSGVVPQLSLILGPCAGGAVYSPAMTDFTVMVEGISHMYVTGPDVVASITGERTTHEELGGALTNASVSGNAHYVAPDEPDAFDWARALLSYLPSNCRTPPPEYQVARVTGVTEADRALDTAIPDRDVELYDMRRVLRGVLDEGEFLEVHELFGASVVVGFGRIEGRSVGVVANQPLVRGGVLDIDASEKAARFVRFCDAFGLPILTFADVPGYLPGIDQERSGIIRRGAKLIYAYAEATVPKLTVVTRKAFGGGYAVMGSKHLGADLNLAWPTAQIAVMGAEAATQVLHARDLAEAAAVGRADEVRAGLVEEYREQFASPYLAAERGYVDEVIAPRETRWRLAQSLRSLYGTRSPAPDRVHGNIPL
jgi:propionyl-CoA carboxylase beta chain